jgi:PAS domain S-box-containing protein
MRFMNAAGDMAARIRNFDWSATPLGSMAEWPQSLATTVGMMLAAPNPMVLLWGPEGVLLYNDGYARFAGARHPHLLGMGAREGWPEIADFNDGNIRRGLAGEAWSLEGQELVLDRHGAGPQSAWLDLHYAPVPDEKGEPAGVMVFVTEITDRIHLLREQAEAVERLELALSAGRGVGAWDWDIAADRVTADERFAALYGVDAELARQGAPIESFFHAIHPDDLPTVKERIAQTLETGVPFNAEYRLIQPGGQVKWVMAEARCSAPDADGRPRRLPGISFDISERKQAEARKAALLRLHDALRDLDDPPALSVAAARVVGQTLGVNRAVYASVDAGEDHLVIGEGWTADDLDRLPPSLALRSYGAFVDDLRAGRTIAIPDVRQDDRTRHAGPAFEAKDVRAFVAVPVLERDRLVAVLSVSCRQPRDWLSEDLAFMRDVVERTRSGVERARAGQALRNSEARLRFLDALGKEVAHLTDPDPILAVTNRKLGEHMGAAICAYADMDDDQNGFTIRADWSATGSPSIVGRYSLADFGKKAVEALNAGRPFVTDDVTLLPAEEAATFQSIGIAATICMPLVKEGRLIALMAVHDSVPRAWTREELMLVHEVTQRSWAHVERIRSEVEREESESRYRTLFNTMDEGFCIIEFIDGPEGALSDYVHVEANAAYAENAGIPGVVGRRVRDMVPDEAESWIALYREVLQTGRSIRFEKELEATGRWLELAAFRIEPSHRRQVAVLFKDLTARKQAEKALADLNASLEARVDARTEELKTAHEALRQSQKMEAVGQLTGGIAHDFNNLLAGISGSLELIAKRMAQGRTADILRYVEAAQGASQRAAALTQRLLAFSRRQTLDPRPTDVNRLIAGMEDLIRRTVGPDVEVEVVGAGGLWPVEIDQSQLENALLNLCINARDAMAPDGGRLTIETANKWLDDHHARERDLAPGQYVSLCVTDTGSGMSPDMIERIFEPFFTTKPIGQGTGLGLSMIHGFVRQSRGQVRVYSEVGTGTTMCLYLPRHHGSVTEPDAQASGRDTGWGHGETVLIIDDEPSVRMLVAEVLREQGYATLEAGDGPGGR